jgi:predicted transcriptional regulator of viral defense system
MKTIELMEKLKKIPLFTINDLAKITGLGLSSVRMLAWRLSKKNLIKHIERAKYSAIDEPLVIASYIVRPSYIGLYSALRFHDMTTQMISAIDVIVPKARKLATIDKRRIIFTKTKHFWGFEKYRVGEFEVLVSDPEKTIVDCLLTGKVRPHVVFRALRSREIDEERLFSYVQKINNSALGKRMGFLLERAGYDAGSYRAYVKGKYTKLDQRKPEKGRKNKEWKVIINEVVS